MSRHGTAPAALWKEAGRIVGETKRAARVVEGERRSSVRKREKRGTAETKEQERAEAQQTERRKRRTRLRDDRRRERECVYVCLRGKEREGAGHSPQEGERRESERESQYLSETISQARETEGTTHIRTHTHTHTHTHAHRHTQQRKGESAMKWCEVDKLKRAFSPHSPPSAHSRGRSHPCSTPDRLQLITRPRERSFAEEKERKQSERSEAAEKRILAGNPSPHPTPSLSLSSLFSSLRFASSLLLRSSLLP